MEEKFSYNSFNFDHITPAREPCKEELISSAQSKLGLVCGFCLLLCRGHHPKFQKGGGGEV